jgi:hypothetical protein
MNKFELSVALISIVLEAVLLGVLIRNRLYRSFIWFCSYLASDLLLDITLIAVRKTYDTYFLLYWISVAVLTLLIFFVIQEAFRAVFQRFYALHWFRFVYPAASFILIAIGSMRSLPSTGSPKDLLIGEIFSLEIAAGILQVGIFFLFLVLVQFFRVPWKQYTFGIALGFGMSATGSLVAFMVRSEFGTKFDPIFRFVVPMTYTIGVAIWLLTFLWPMPKAQLEVTAPALTPEAVVTELKQYTQTVKEILKR